MWVGLILFACSTPTVAPAPPEAPAPAPKTAAPVAVPAEAPAPRAPRDRPPEILGITLAPTEVRRADPLRAAVKASDPEGQSLDLDYEWLINDRPVIDVATDRLGAGRYEKGDVVRVRVTADDGENQVTAESESVTVLNTPPAFETGGRDMGRVDGFVFKATDPDGDPLKWRLEGAPGGMAISPQGKISYTGSEEEPGGRYTVAVIVEDGEAYGRFEFPLTVTPGSKAAAAKK
ncbi:MAG: hypothetical protein Q8P41_22330 [Pseudomonadota bacterium]|nr:hypothetical protein [Pseudomonadota bacterium]